MAGRPPPVQQPRFRDRERARAEADEPGAARVGPPYGVQDLPGAGGIGVGPVRHDQRVRVLGRLQPRDIGEREETVPHPGPRPGGAQPEVVQLAAEFGRRSSKTSMAQLISKGFEFSSTTRTTRWTAPGGVAVAVAVAVAVGVGVGVRVGIGIGIGVGLGLG